jgi:F-type H+-transporting ATPase subunit delta
LIENDRLSLLPEISALFDSRKNEREGVVEAQIESAFPLDDAALSQLVGDLERRFKRKVRPQVRVDRELIGGALIKVGDEVIDGSVRGRLESMASALRT